MEERKDKQTEGNSLILIPKMEKYVEYVLCMLLKIPRTEKYSIGNEYKLSMYKMLEKEYDMLLIEKSMFLNKISIRSQEVKQKQYTMVNKEMYLEHLNKIDTLLNCQRIYLRIMDKNHWIDQKKFYISMEYTYEIGKILGGLFKYYAKNNPK